MEGNVKPYDAGTADVGPTGVKVAMEMEVHQLLIYPTVDATLSLNGGTTKDIFLPKGIWTPVSISRDFYCTDFVVTSDLTGKVHWQGWVI